MTITYDDSKHDEETFRSKLKKCLSNFHSRYCWRYMGVFERSPSGRLHFHGLFWIPGGARGGASRETRPFEGGRPHADRLGERLLREEVRTQRLFFPSLQQAGIRGSRWLRWEYIVIGARGVSIRGESPPIASSRVGKPNPLSLRSQASLSRTFCLTTWLRRCLRSSCGRSQSRAALRRIAVLVP